MANTQTKKQLLDKVKILELTNSLQSSELDSLRRQTKNMLQDFLSLDQELKKTRSEFEAFKIGTKEFSRRAEEEIVKIAAEKTALRVDLLHALTGAVYIDAQHSCK